MRARSRAQRRVRRAAAALLATALAVGCAGTREPSAEVPREGLAAAPVWLLQDCAAYWGDDAEHHVCGVGSAVGPANPALARSTAEGRGRTEVARQLHERLRSVLVRASGPWDVVDASKRITDASLPGTALVASWLSPHGTFYALVALDIATFAETVRGLEDLPDALREEVLARTDRVFAPPAPDRRAGAARP